MVRVKSSVTHKRRVKRLLKRTEGNFLGRGKLYRHARETENRAGFYAFIGRKQKKRQYRRLWITRLTAACRARGLMYSRFIHALGLAGILLDRKQLSELAIHDPAAFDQIFALAQAAAAAAPAAAPVAIPVAAAKN